MAEAADRYLQTYIELAGRLGAEWIVVHAGYHFGSDQSARQAAGLERLQRAAALAERANVRLLLENLNREPEHAEVRYLAHNLEECRYYFDKIQSPNMGWAFTINHAHLVPEGIDGFLDAMDVRRCGEVRVADSHGRYEQHLRPGEGTIDFARMFRRIEDGSYRGHYMMAFGTLDDMVKGRETLVRAAGE
jgi:sugar phosphate isomerase/epimerase